MTPEELRERTTSWAVDVITLCRVIRKTIEGQPVADQLGRSAAAVASTDRGASRARSRREFVAKLGLAVEEADESVGWIELAVRCGMIAATDANACLCEARQILAILVASRTTAKRNMPK